MKYLNLLLIILFIFSCDAADQYMGVNQKFLPETEEKDDIITPPRGYYNNITEAMADGIIAYWRMDEVLAGGNIEDETTYMNGTSAVNISVISGKFSNAFAFNGVDSNFILTQAYSYTTAPRSYTFSFWAYKTDNGYIIDIQTGRLYIYFDAATGEVTLYAPNAVRDFGSYVPASYTWNHIVVTCKGDAPIASTLYVNGILRGTAAYAATSISAIKRIGCTYTGAAPFYGGYLDDFAIWSRCLTESEVLALYNTDGPIIK